MMAGEAAPAEGNPTKLCSSSSRRLQPGPLAVASSVDDPSLAAQAAAPALPSLTLAGVGGCVWKELEEAPPYLGRPGLVE